MLCSLNRRGSQVLWRRQQVKEAREGNFTKSGKSLLGLKSVFNEVCYFIQVE